MSESDGLRLGKVAVSRIFRDEAKLKQLLNQVKESGINVETCGFNQVESFVREMSSHATAIPARGGTAVVIYQDLPDNEGKVLDEFFKQQVKEAKAKHPELFK